MTEYEAYQEHIRYTHDTYCRIVIRHASFDAARMLAARWKREIFLEYLTEEKNEESQHHRRKAQQPQPPVERQQQHQQPHRGGNGVVLVGQLVGKIGLGGSGTLVDDLAQLTAAEGLGKAQRQHCQMLRHCQPQIGRHPERRQMGAHQRCNINKVRQHRE